MAKAGFIRGQARRGSFALAAALVALSACSTGDSTGPEATRYLDEVHNFVVQNDVQYGSATAADGTTQTLLLDLFQPQGSADTQRPVILWLHGGGFTHGHKGEMTEFARRFARRGYVSAAVNYRLRTGQEFDYTKPNDPIGELAKRDAQHDVQAAVRWFRANAQELGIDPNRIIVAGYSAGATTALRVALRPGDAGSSGNPGFPSNVAAVVAIGGSLAPGELAQVSVPVLLIHGENDTKIRLQDMSANCQGTSLCRLISVAGADHALSTFSRDVLIQETAEFVYGGLLNR